MPRHEGGAGLCPPCAGPGWYRRMIDGALAGGDEYLEERCQRCGGLTYYGELVAEQARLGLE
jgi:hypothetical protein